MIELLTHRPYYVTKLRQKSYWPPIHTEDLYLERASSDEPYHKVLYETEYRYVHVAETAEPSSQVESESVTGERATSERGNWTLLGSGLALLGALAVLAFVWRRRSHA